MQQAFADTSAAVVKTYDMPQANSPERKPRQGRLLDTLNDSLIM